MANLFAAEAPPAVAYALVAVERSVDRYPNGLTYGIPVELRDLRVGERVIVPLGRGDTSTAGYIIDRSDDRPGDIDPHRIKLIVRRDHTSAMLPADLVELARWISAYYVTPIGITLATMLPAAVKRNVGAVTQTSVDLAEGAADRDVKLPVKQRALLELLRSIPEHERPVDLHDLLERAGAKTRGPLNKLAQLGLVQLITRNRIQAKWTEQAGDAFVPDALTGPQQRVIDALVDVLEKGFSRHLLFGVTGSGKTEVYLRLIERVVQKGKVALMLVPEIALTPQTSGRLLGRFPNEKIAILHSGLTAAQRHQQWALAASGEASIIIGARSAVFAPIPSNDASRKLGLIIVDEEHDSSYKQDQAPRYHGRDVAIRRAQMAACPILLGSATPALETWHNAHQSKSGWTLHRLTERVPGMSLPHVEVLDFAEERKKRQRQRRDRMVHLIGPRMESLIGQTLDADGQILLLLNRRGYANYIACPDQACGWVMTCDHCDVTVVYHLDKAIPPRNQGGFVQCHHCLAQQRLPEQCPLCQNRVSTFGLGTQRVEKEVAQKFPQLIENRTMVRVDSDTMHTAADFHDTLGRFGAGEIRMLLGTQMIAKGLDFPNVQLVGVINADTALNLPDFRASERTFQLVNQVVGRCARGGAAGRVVVQSFNPAAPAIQLAARNDYVTFAQRELADRRESMLPPITRMARIVVRDEDHLKAIARSRALARDLQALLPREVRMEGPMPCAIARVADKHRHQVVLLAPNAAIMQQALAAARTAGLLKADAEMAVDVDPVTML